jgi:hypothetical protein
MQKKVFQTLRNAATGKPFEVTLPKGGYDPKKMLAVRLAARKSAISFMKAFKAK